MLSTTVTKQSGVFGHRWIKIRFLNTNKKENLCKLQKFFKECPKWASQFVIVSRRGKTPATKGNITKGG